MTPDAQQTEYIITEDELESLYAMTHIKYEQQVTEIHQHVHTRPHPPAPENDFEQDCYRCREATTHTATLAAKESLELLKKKVAWGKEIDRNHLFSYNNIEEMIQEAEQRTESLRQQAGEQE